MEVQRGAYRGERHGDNRGDVPATSVRRADAGPRALDPEGTAATLHFASSVLSRDSLQRFLCQALR